MNRLIKMGIALALLCACLSHNAAAQSKVTLAAFPAVQAFANEYENVEIREAIQAVTEGKFGQAIPVLKQAAADGDLAGNYTLAVLHTIGQGVERSESAASAMLEKNVDVSHLPSMVLLALLKEKNAPGESVRYYKFAASEGDTFANLKLGQAFENGQLGLTKNPTLAAKYYTTASDAGSADGQYNAGRCFAAGIGVSPNALDANRLFRLAAMAGVKDAHTALAKRYFAGQGVVADPVAAVGWLTRGAQMGSTEAMVLLGQRYEEGKVLNQDLNVAGQLYSRAAKMNDVTGKYHLALLYYSGKGTNPDPVRAYVLLAGAKTLPQANQLFEKIESELTAEQLAFAKEKIEEANTGQ